GRLRIAALGRSCSAAAGFGGTPAPPSLWFGGSARAFKFDLFFEVVVYVAGAGAALFGSRCAARRFVFKVVVLLAVGHGCVCARSWVGGGNEFFFPPHNSSTTNSILQSWLCRSMMRLRLSRTSNLTIETVENPSTMNV